MSSTPQKPGWVNVPGKGRRYWTGSEYRFYGPSDNPASKGQNSVSGDVAGMWNNFVNQWGKSTSDPKQVGAQNMTPAQIKAKKGKVTKDTDSGSKDSKTGAPPQAAESPKTYTVAGVTYDTATGRPVNAPEGGYSLTSDGGTVPHSSSDSGSTRTNANGLVSYGKDLSSLNQFTREFTGGYEITDLKSAFQSEDLPTAYQSGSNSISTEETSYELPEGAAPSPLNEGLAGASDLQISDSGYTIGEASVPGTVGRTGDAQEGSSSKPDIAEEVRTIRMRRKGPRDDGGPRGFAIDNHNAKVAEANAPKQESGGIYNNPRRNKIRSAFLDSDLPTPRAIAAANAEASFGKDSNGDPVFNVGGELVYAKEGMKQKAKDAAMMGKNPMEFLAIGGDTPTETQLQSGLKPGDVTASENTGGSLETPAPMTKPSPEKFKETQDFLSQNISMLTRKTK